MAQEIGSINAILSGVRTKVDGSVAITFEANPQEINVVNKLMQAFLMNERLFVVAFIGVSDE